MDVPNVITRIKCNRTNIVSYVDNITGDKMTMNRTNVSYKDGIHKLKYGSAISIELCDIT